MCWHRAVYLACCLLLRALLAKAQRPWLGWPAEEASVTTQVFPARPVVDWFLDSLPNQPPPHPFRLRGRFRSHPNGCPSGTTWQSSIYTFWSDENTTQPGLRNGTLTWGGCNPHMQIIHTGSWPSTMWKSTTLLDTQETHSDFPYTAVQNLDPAGQDDIRWSHRQASSCEVLGGQLTNERWSEGIARPIRNPLSWRWGDYVPLTLELPTNWSAWRPLPASCCGYEMYMPNGRGGNRAKPWGCGPQYNGPPMLPELPVRWSWDNPCGPASAQTAVASPQKRVRKGPASIGRIDSRTHKSPANPLTRNGCNTFGPTTTVILQIGMGREAVCNGACSAWSSSFVPQPSNRQPIFPPRAPTCTFKEIKWLDIAQFQAFPYNYSSLGLLMSHRNDWKTGNGDWWTNYDGGFSLIMHAQPSNMYESIRIMDQYTKYGQSPNAIWHEATHTGTNEYLMHVVKPVWNTPVGGVLFWNLAIRGCNTDRGGDEVEQYTVSVNGRIENGVSGIVLLQGSEDQNLNLLVNATAINLTAGWHTLEVRSKQRTGVWARNKGENRMLITKHRFEFITDWPATLSACSDFITYPYWIGDYRARADDWGSYRASGGWAHGGGFTNSHATRVRMFKANWNWMWYISKSLFYFDMSWLKERRTFRSVDLYLSWYGLAWPSSAPGATLTVYALDTEVFPPAWYPMDYWSPENSIDVDSNLFNWVSIEPRLKAVGSFYIDYTRQGPNTNLAPGKYIGVHLDVEWFNAWSLSRAPTFSLVISATADTGTTIMFYNYLGFENAPGGLPAFVRFLPADASCAYIRQ